MMAQGEKARCDQSAGLQSEYARDRHRGLAPSSQASSQGHSRVMHMHHCRNPSFVSNIYNMCILYILHNYVNPAVYTLIQSLEAI